MTDRAVRDACAAALAVLALAPALSRAADCDLALQQARFVADEARRAFAAPNYVEAGNIAASTRIPAIDAAQSARACGCPAAAPPLEVAITTAQRATLAFNLDGAQSYAAQIRKQADLAQEALRRCGAR
jgi:hypothetical protein